MAFTLDRVVPWGRSFVEYERMFALGPLDLQRRILGCADGPASFNAEATAQGAKVVSVDPIYALPAAQIRRQIKETCPQVLEQTRNNRDSFVWREFATIEQLGRSRLRGMARFLADFEANRATGRYIAGELPNLRFGDSAFDLALCSHFLFLYSDRLGERFHLKSVAELCRVASEVRIFPLLDLGKETSRHVDAVVREVTRLGREVKIEQVPYEFQRGGNQMMRIT